MIEPALSAAEWEDPMGGNLDFRGEGEQRATSGCCSCDLGSRRGLAARCMDGQEWGFTWEDVRRNRAQAAMMRESVERWGDLAGGIAGATVIEESAALSAWHDSMADRLEALLRPEAS